MRCQGEQPPTCVIVCGINFNTAMGLFLRILKDVETNCSNYTRWLQPLQGCGIMCGRQQRAKIRPIYAQYGRLIGKNSKGCEAYATANRSEERRVGKESSRTTATQI